MQWIYIICFALISAGLLALFGVRPGDFIDALFRSQRKAAHCVFQEVFHGCLSL